MKTSNMFFIFFVLLWAIESIGDRVTDKEVDARVAVLESQLKTTNEYLANAYLELEIDRLDLNLHLLKEHGIKPTHLENHGLLGKLYPFWSDTLQSKKIK